MMILRVGAEKDVILVDFSEVRNPSNSLLIDFNG